MCGIIGYVGTNNATPILINGLKKLEYRGYDSVGIALQSNDKIKVYKEKGRVAALEDNIKDISPSGVTGIGHTRWATHGSPEKKNAHPHVSNDGRVAVVHNGIIENHAELKSFLKEKGITFFSDTDTEVIPNLISYFYKGNVLQATLKAAAMLKGSFALGIMLKDAPDLIVALKKESPLIVGIGKNENYMASDIPAILELTREVVFLEDGDCAIITPNKTDIFDAKGKPLQREIKTVSFDISAAEKGGYEHFMLKEIYEQPEAVARTLSGKITNTDTVNIEGLSGRETDRVKRIYIVGCGTAYHAGLVGKALFDRVLGLPTEVDIASEFRYRDPIIDEGCLTVVISQSGETADTLAALRLAKERGSRVVAITNVVGSSVSREADHVVYTAAGPEIAVASTKAFTTQLTALYLLAILWGRTNGTLSLTETKNWIETIKVIPSFMTKILSDHRPIREFCKRISEAKNIFYLGRGMDYPLALEGALKLKEISYIHAEAYPAGELKHGPIALIENGTPIVCLSSQSPLHKKIESNVREVTSRGATVFGIIPSGVSGDFCDYAYNFPLIDDVFSPLVTAIPMQLIAYYTALIKGVDLDKPRNLAKSVTVE